MSWHYGIQIRCDFAECKKHIFHLLKGSEGDTDYTDWYARSAGWGVFKNANHGKSYYCPKHAKQMRKVMEEVK